MKIVTTPGDTEANVLFNEYAALTAKALIASPTAGKTFIALPATVGSSFTTTIAMPRMEGGKVTEFPAVLTVATRTYGTVIWKPVVWLLLVKLRLSTAVA